jgi:hypothetical protein
MVKILLFLTLFVFTGSGFQIQAPIVLTQPRISNVYPQSFGIHWKLNPSTENIDRYRNKRVDVVIQDHFDDVLDSNVELSDTIVTFEFTYKQARVIFPQVEFSKSEGYQMGGAYGYGLKVISAVPEIDNLIARVKSEPTMINYLQLADMYERSACYVNAIYAYYQVTLLDEKVGRTYWKKFIERNDFTYRRFEGMQR